MNKQHIDNTIKTNGRVYTPDYLVKNILDMANYSGLNILRKHVIDNSCGNGSFLLEIVSRYCESSFKIGKPIEDIRNELSFYVHGIEIDEQVCNICRNRLNSLIKQFNIDSVNWDIRCADTLKVHEYDGKMDYVLGNPPYVRVHNINNPFTSIKDFSFTKKGMTDLYLVFYEIGINMMNSCGTLGYITPSSFFNSIAGKYMRNYVVEHNMIDKIIDLKHYQAFDATTYTSVVILKNNRLNESISYYQYNEENLMPYFIDSLTTNDYYLNDNFYFSDINRLQILKDIFQNQSHCDITVKNGYATLCDNVFIHDFDFDSKYIIPIIKASTGKIKKVFYPYDKNAKLVTESEIKEDNNLYNYLLENKEILCDRSLEKSNKNAWYAFGRSQAINDTYKNKLSINTVIREIDDIKLVDAPPGIGVYSGLYIMSNIIDISCIRKILLTQDFIEYVSLLGKYKNNGYYTFSSRDLKSYLDYQFTTKGVHSYDDKQRFSQCS